MANIAGSVATVVRLGALAVSLVGAAASHAAVITGVNLAANQSVLISESGPVGSGFANTIERTLTAEVGQFNIDGAVLLQAGVGFRFAVTSSGGIDFIPPAQDLASGGEVFAQEVLSGVSGSDSCATRTGGSRIECSEAVSDTFFVGVAPEDWSIILGFGTFNLTDAGISRFVGGCRAGASQIGTCLDNVQFSHTALFEMINPRIEYTYCLPGEFLSGSSGAQCAAAIPGVNSPSLNSPGGGFGLPTTSVPEPGTLALLGLGLAGLGLARRKRAA